MGVVYSHISTCFVTYETKIHYFITNMKQIMHILNKRMRSEKNCIFRIDTQHQSKLVVKYLVKMPLEF